jgi:hypothetical protein
MEASSIPNLNERFSRQLDILNPDAINQYSYTIIGTGAIGRHVSLLLAQSGAKEVQIIDHDTIETANLGPQGWSERDVNQAKVDVIEQHMKSLNSEIHVHKYQRRYGRSMHLGQIIFCCVDALTTRQFIWENAGSAAICFIDGRMAAETARVLIAYDAVSRAYYPTTFVAQEDVFQGGCTRRSTCYCAAIAGGLLIAQFAKWMRGLAFQYDYSFNIQTSEIMILKEADVFAVTDEFQRKQFFNGMQSHIIIPVTESAIAQKVVF